MDAPTVHTYVRPIFWGEGLVVVVFLPAVFGFGVGFGQASVESAEAEPGACVGWRYAWAFLVSAASYLPTTQTLRNVVFYVLGVRFYVTGITPGSQVPCIFEVLKF